MGDFRELERDEGGGYEALGREIVRPAAETKCAMSEKGLACIHGRGLEVSLGGSIDMSRDELVSQLTLDG
jgi:hypothetical protein